MDKPLIDALAERVEVLEQNNRSLRKRVEILTGIIAIMILGLLSRVAVPRHDQRPLANGASEVTTVKSQAFEATTVNAQVVTAGAFSLTDREGRQRASLRMNADEEPAFALYDKQSNVKVSIKTDFDGTDSLEFLGNSGHAVRIGQRKGGAPFIELLSLEEDGRNCGVFIGQIKKSGMVFQAFGRSGKVASQLGSLGDGSASLSFTNGSKTGINDLGINQNGSPFLCLRDRGSNPRLFLGGIGADGFGLSIMDTEAKPRIQTYVMADGWAGQELFDSEGRRRLISCVNSERTPVITLLGTDENSHVALVIPPQGLGKPGLSVRTEEGSRLFTTTGKKIP